MERPVCTAACSKHHYEFFATVLQLGCAFDPSSCTVHREPHVPELGSAAAVLQEATISGAPPVEASSFGVVCGPSLPLVPVRLSLVALRP